MYPTRQQYGHGGRGGYGYNPVMNRNRPFPARSFPIHSFSGLSGFHALSGLSGEYQDILSATGSAAGTGASAGAIVSSSAMAGPIGAAIGAGVAGVVLLIAHFKRVGQQKVAATDIVNAVEPYMQQNLAAYLASNRTQSENAASQDNFRTLWDIVVQKCSDPSLGSAGERCINERREGGVAPWGRNWFQMYLDPIRNDSNVISDPNIVTDPATGQPVHASQLTGSASPLDSLLGPKEIIPGVSNTLLLAGAALAAVFLLIPGGGGGK